MITTLICYSFVNLFYSCSLQIFPGYKMHKTFKQIFCFFLLCLLLWFFLESTTTEIVLIIPIGRNWTVRSKQHIEICRTCLRSILPMFIVCTNRCLFLQHYSMISATKKDISICTIASRQNPNIRWTIWSICMKTVWSGKECWWAQVKVNARNRGALTLFPTKTSIVRRSGSTCTCRVGEVWDDDNDNGWL